MNPGTVAERAQIDAARLRMRARALGQMGNIRGCVRQILGGNRLFRGGRREAEDKREIFAVGWEEPRDGRGATGTMMAESRDRRGQAASGRGAAAD